ncbi:MAG: hypothetical protein JWN61_3314 [Pseudonocardiales bacterium]|nr:hypothetical protein [Pseudonocardiales bacterium]
MPKAPRLAAGRARALGLPTRGTTNPNRLRRMDRWIAHACAPILRAAADPLVVDLGYGASPVTAVELAERLRPLRPDVRVLGIEIDPDRVAAAQASADPPRLEFVRGGFELAGRTPLIVRAANVLRQYPVEAAHEAWSTVRERLAPNGVLIDGTCDEIGRRSAWIAIDRDGPRTLSVSMHLETLEHPGEVAERLPKALIHRNVPGEGVHDFLRALDAAWAAAAPHSAFGARQRFVAAAEAMARDWPLRDGRARWRLGELTVDWAAVAPR